MPDDALAQLQAERAARLLRVAHGVGDAQVAALLVEQLDRKGLESVRRAMSCGNLLEQLVEVEHRRDLAPELEQGEEQRRVAGRRYAVGWWRSCEVWVGHWHLRRKRRLSRTASGGAGPEAGLYWYFPRRPDGTASRTCNARRSASTPRNPRMFRRAAPQACPPLRLAPGGRGVVALVLAGLATVQGASREPVRARHGMVGSADAHASTAGLDILKRAATPSTPPSPWVLRWP